MPGVLDTTVRTPSAFDHIAARYDTLFTSTPIGLAQRKSVCREMDRVFRSGHRVLEINCGTGSDALRLAGRDVRVHACDASPEMIALARARLLEHPNAPVEFSCLSTEALDELPGAATFDGVLSNFAGLDCVRDLAPVAGNLARLVRPGGRVVVCVFGACCLWEILWYACRHNPAKALRRFCRGGVVSSISPGTTVTVHYRTVRALARHFAPHFRLERWRGVGIAIPPTYADAFPTRFPFCFRLAGQIDPWLGRCPGLRSLADHAVLTLRREPGP